MHGSFHSHADGVSVHFDAPVLVPSPGRPWKWRANAAALLAGCCVAALPIASWPTSEHQAARQHPVHVEHPIDIVAPSAAPTLPTSVAAGPRVERPKPLLAVNSRPPATIAPANPVSEAPVAMASAPAPERPEPLSLPDVIPVAIVPEIPRIAVASLPPPPFVVILPDPAPAPSLAVVEEPPSVQLAAPSPPPVTPLRKVDVAQIAESEIDPPLIPQLHEPGLAAGAGDTLATKIAAMQVTPPPPVRLRESDRAGLLAEAPTNMILRIGDSAVGKVDFKMTDTHGIDVRLSSLLDALAGHYDEVEFARLRGSAAADSYVSFDQLRSLGLTVRYDPVYDELRIKG